MVETVKEYMKKLNMVTSGETIVVGVSGGADSVCLLFLLMEIKKEIPMDLVVVHVNHEIRKEAIEDETYVKTLCEEYNLPFVGIHEDIRKLAKEQGITEEEAGRKVRYEAFLQALGDYGNGKGKIAVAHTKDDQAETVLFHLFRGTGLTGLQGIRPVREQIIRPLLCVNREQIEEFLEQRGISYQEDATNEEDTYARNRIRHHILPYANSEICSQAADHIAETAELFGEADAYLQKEIATAYHEVVKENNKEKELFIMKEALQSMDSYLQKGVILKCFETLVPYRKDITLQHVTAVLELFNKQVSKRISLPYHLQAVRTYAGLVVMEETKTLTNLIPKQPVQISLDAPAVYKIEDLGEVEISVFNYAKIQLIPEKTYTKWFDYDKIVKPLELRNREKGDFFIANTKNDRQSIKSYMINEKIPSKDRDHIYLLCEGSHVLWLIGYRISEAYKVDENTTKILQVQIRGGDR